MQRNQESPIVNEAIKKVIISKLRSNAMINQSLKVIFAQGTSLVRSACPAVSLKESVSSEQYLSYQIAFPHIKSLDVQGRHFRIKYDLSFTKLLVDAGIAMW